LRGQNGAVAIYAAMDGPTYASLRPAVRVRQIAGWAFLAVGALRGCCGLRR
jgi:hypothetical protein